MSGELTMPVTVACVAAMIAAATDIWSFKIHNVLTLPLLFTGLAYHGIVEGRVGLGASLLGAMFAFGVLILPYMTGGTGAGDVKLLAGIGAWVCLPWVMYIFLAASIAAGVYAMLMVLVHSRFQETWSSFRLLWLRLSTLGRHLQDEDRVESQVQRDDRRQRLIPFAAMVALGVLATIALMSLNAAFQE